MSRATTGFFTRAPASPVPLIASLGSGRERSSVLETLALSGPDDAAPTGLGLFPTLHDHGLFGSRSSQHCRLGTDAGAPAAHGWCGSSGAGGLSSGLASASPICVAWAMDVPDQVTGLHVETHPLRSPPGSQSSRGAVRCASHHGAHNPAGDG